MAALALIVGGTIAAVDAAPAQAHGAMMKPGSREYLCWQDALSGNGGLSPTNAACAAAIAKSGPNMIYNWFGNLRSNAGGRGQGYLADGTLCSSGSPASDAPYDFSGYNLARSDWPLTHLTSGASFNWWYSNWAAHPGTWKMWVTKNGHNPSKALAWSDLEPEPFLTVTNPPQQGSVGTNDGHYYWTGNLPSGKSGQHVIFSQWIRSDSQENFFNCSDVVFDGGNGAVTGIRGSGSGGGTTTTTRATTTTTTRQGATTTTTTRQGGGTTTTTTTRQGGGGTTTTTTRSGGGGTGTCSATFSAPNAWGQGFVGNVTVTAGSTALSSWRVTANLPSGTAVTGSWNAARSGTTGAVTFSNESYNGSLGAGASTSFGFQGTGSPSGVTVSCS